MIKIVSIAIFFGGAKVMKKKIYLYMYIKVKFLLSIVIIYKKQSIIANTVKSSSILY